MPIELGTENPLGRPKAHIAHDAVLCGHCESDNTLYMEDVCQHAPFVVQDGLPRCSITDLEIDEEGADPRVWCLGCGQESMLPDGFAWKDTDSEEEAASSVEEEE